MGHSLNNTLAPKRSVPWFWAKRQWLPKMLGKLIFGKPMAPTSEEWAQVNAALMKGDPAMDKVVDWIFSQERPGLAKQQFDQALTRGIESLENPAPELIAFFNIIDNVPRWVDTKRLDLGAKASHVVGRISFYVLRDMALMGGYAYFNSMNHTLDVSGALSTKTTRRLGETGKWLFDVTEIGGMGRFNNGFITTVRVRLIHALVRRHLLQNKAFDTQTWGVPVNQIDMLATYLAFGPVSLMGYRTLGLFVTPKESSDILHLWGYIGWLMGLDEEWIAKKEGDGLRKLYHTFLTHRLPDEKIRQLGRALVEEPLNNSLLNKWQRKFYYHVHISNSSLILGPIQRKQLGIPWYAIPWYPALSAPFVFMHIGWHRLRGRAHWDRYLTQKRVIQRELLDAYFEGEAPKIIEPDQKHPAHVA